MIKIGIELNTWNKVDSSYKTQHYLELNIKKKFPLDSSRKEYLAKLVKLIEKLEL